MVLPKQHIVQCGWPFATNTTTISPATPPTPQSPQPLSREPPFCYVFCRREDQQCEVCGRCEELPVGCNPTRNERIPQFVQPLCTLKLLVSECHFIILHLFRYVYKDRLGKLDKANLTLVHWAEIETEVNFCWTQVRSLSCLREATKEISIFRNIP